VCSYLHIPSESTYHLKGIKKLKNTLKALLFLGASCSQLWAAEFTQEKLNHWAPPHLNVQEKKELFEIMISEKQESIKRNDGEKRDLGMSFPLITPIQQDLLMMIRQYAAEHGVRSKTIDIGSGGGCMARNMILADSECDIVESQIPSFKVILKRIQESKKFLPKNAVIEDYFHEIRTSFFDLKNSLSDYTNKFNFSWSGNVIHLLPIQQCSEYAELLYNITVPGGYGFACVHTPFGVGAGVLKSFENNKKQGKKFPGHLIINQNTTRWYALDNKTGMAYPRLDILPEKITKTCAGTAKMAQEPGTETAGHYNAKQILNIIKENKENDLYLVEVTSNLIMHLFDHDGLSVIFKEAGFIIEDIYYFDGEKDIVKPENIERHKNKSLQLQIKIRKPL